MHIRISLGVLPNNSQSLSWANAACEFANVVALTSAADSSHTKLLPTAELLLEAGPIVSEPLDSVSRTSTVQLNLKRSWPLHIPIFVIKQTQTFDVSGWPPSLAPLFTTCGFCDSPLSKQWTHPGQRGESLLA